MQNFLRSLNYIADFYQNWAQDTLILYTILQKNPPPWHEDHTKVVQKVKLKAKQLSCLCLANSNWFKIVETDVFNIGYGGILK